MPDGDGVGYWLVAADGGIFSFNAPFKGSMGGISLNQPVTGMVRFGNGYLMVAADGGIFNFSSQPFHGSLGDRPPALPIVSVAAFDGNDDSFAGPVTAPDVVGDSRAHPDQDAMAPPADNQGAVRYCEGHRVTLHVPAGHDNRKNIFHGTDGPDVIMGTDGPDWIDAGAGDDVVCGEGGNDMIWGGSGNDELHGNAGDDNIYDDRRSCDPEGSHDPDAGLYCGTPAPGNHDLLFGGEGDDRLDGGDGDDYLSGGEGDDILEGWRGSDEVWGGPGYDQCFLQAGVIDEGPSEEDRSEDCEA